MLCTPRNPIVPQGFLALFDRLTYHKCYTFEKMQFAGLPGPFETLARQHFDPARSSFSVCRMIWIGRPPIKTNAFAKASFFYLLFVFVMAGLAQRLQFAIKE